MNGADSLCDALLAHEVDVCFANPGTSEMHFVAALDNKPDMRCILGLFEGVVTGAADGYARMTDKPAATLLHLGPGLANGLANLHNARRAHTPMINIIGDHARDHLRHDAPLTTDIDSLARPMSQWVGRISDANDVVPKAAQAYVAAMSKPGVATLILPADAAWTDVPPRPITRSPLPVPDVIDTATLAEAIALIRSGRKIAFILGGRALRADVLEKAGKVAHATGVELLAETSNSRIERGCGRVPVTRIPYAVDAALKLLGSFDGFVLVGAKVPAAFFAYPGKPGRLVKDDSEIVTLAHVGQNLLQAFEQLTCELGLRNRSFTSLAAPSILSHGTLRGNLTGDIVAAVVARMMPDSAIICDESITSARSFLALSKDAPPHDYLQLTGGAIGIGIPLSTGAAIACPDRKVITLQADGSGMYTVQGLWTQARERLNVVTIILANRTYATLRGEMHNVGVTQYGPNAKRMIDIEDPELNWVSLAKGMGVEAASTDTAETFSVLLAEALQRHGPFLIEARI